LTQKGKSSYLKTSANKQKLQPNNKLALINFKRDGEVCCIAMVKVDELESTVKNMLGPVFKTFFQSEEKQP
jgi:antitoxin PrlF